MQPTGRALPLNGQRSAQPGDLVPDSGQKFRQVKLGFRAQSSTQLSSSIGAGDPSGHLS